MPWAHYCSNLILGPQLWQNTHIRNEGLHVLWSFYYKRKWTSILGRKGENREDYFLAQLCVTDLISLVAAAFRHPFQWAAILCLSVDASQIFSLVKQAFVQVPHKNDWFGFYPEFWHLSIRRKDYVFREIFQDGSSETNILNVQFNPLSSPKQDYMGRIFSSSEMKASWKKYISLWDYPAFSPASGGR